MKFPLEGPWVRLHRVACFDQWHVARHTWCVQIGCQDVITSFHTVSFVWHKSARPWRRLCFHSVHKTKKTCRAGPRAPFTQGHHSSEWGAVLIVSAHVSGFLVTTPTKWKRLSCSMFHRGENSVCSLSCHEFLHSPLLLDSGAILSHAYILQPGPAAAPPHALGLTQWTAAVLSRVQEEHANVLGVPHASQEDHQSRWLFLSTRGSRDSEFLPPGGDISCYSRR